MLLAVDALGLNRPHIHPRKSEISRRLTLIQRHFQALLVCAGSCYLPNMALRSLAFRQTQKNRQLQPNWTGKYQQELALAHHCTLRHRVS